MIPNCEVRLTKNGIAQPWVPGVLFAVVGGMAQVRVLEDGVWRHYGTYTSNVRSIGG